MWPWVKGALFWRYATKKWPDVSDESYNATACRYFNPKYDIFLNLIKHFRCLNLMKMLHFHNINNSLMFVTNLYFESLNRPAGYVDPQLTYLTSWDSLPLKYPVTDSYFIYCTFDVDVIWQILQKCQHDGLTSECRRQSRNGMKWPTHSRLWSFNADCRHEGEKKQNNSVYSNRFEI